MVQTMVYLFSCVWRLDVLSVLYLIEVLYFIISFVFVWCLFDICIVFCVCVWYFILCLHFFGVSGSIFQSVGTSSSKMGFKLSVVLDCVRCCEGELSLDCSQMCLPPLSSYNLHLFCASFSIHFSIFSLFSFSPPNILLTLLETFYFEKMLWIIPTNLFGN